MSAIVYCLYVPEHDETGKLEKLPDNVLRWFATYPGENNPVEYGVIPYLIPTGDEQIALRSIASRAHEVIAMHIVEPKLRPLISRVVMHAADLPLTWIADAFRSTATFSGIVSAHGLEMEARGGDNVLLRKQVERLEQYPLNKCYDQIQSARVKEAVRLRAAGVRDTPFVRGADTSPSCSMVHLSTFERIVQDKGDRTAEYPLTALAAIKRVSLSPKPKPRSLDTSKPRPPEHYAVVATAPVEPPLEPPLEPLPEPEHPPAKRAYAGDGAPPQSYWWNRDND